MPTPDHHRARRTELLSRLETPVLLFAGGARPRNYPDNPYPDRADSNFLFFFGSPERDAAALFDPEDATVTLFLPERTTDTALWMGEVPSFEAVREATGVDRVLDVERLEEHARKLLRGRGALSLAVADPRARERARRITGLDLDFDDPIRIGPTELVDVLADLRLRKNEAELSELRRAAEVTGQAFVRAMAETTPGASEQVLWGEVEGCFARGGGVPGFQTILSARGEVLHNHRHDGILRAGDLVLLDAGAEMPSGYGADVTRTWPASGRFAPEQRAVYEIVLRAQRDAIEAVRPGARYRDIHRGAARVLAEGLVDLGLLRGDPGDLVERGAHALFFPHGVGHLLGLDTHDLESFGDRILYGDRRRSDQFGTSFLRIDLDLEPGMVVTIEPGLYFVPAILRGSGFRSQFRDAVDFERAERYLDMNGGRGFGGTRIEDDVAVTEGGPEVLTSDVPKEMEEVEAAVGTGSAREVGVRR